MSSRSGLKASLIVASLSVASALDTALTLIQANVRAYEARLPVKPNPVPPRMYVSEGCDGSTATLQHAIKILALHGIDGGDYKTNKEMLPWNSLGGMKKWHKEYLEKNQTLVFKSILHRDMLKTMNMKKLDTLAVYVTRKNSLDQMVCMIRDCFVNTDTHDSVFGFAVKDNGKPSNLCFKRRSEKGTYEKAKLRVFEEVPSGRHNRSFLEENLKTTQDRVKDGIAKLKKGGYTAPLIWYEDIMAFEAGGEENMKTSLKAWQTLLKAWGIAAKSGAIRDYMAKESKSWKPQRQQATIHNYNEVAEELKRLGRHDLLRSE